MGVGYMKIPRPKKFRIGTTIEDVIKYLEIQLPFTLDEIVTALNNLSFSDNFKSEIVTVTITAGAELPIRHSLGTVPSGWIALKTTGSSITDGPTEWTEDFIYLKNNGATDATVKLVILR